MWFYNLVVVVLVWLLLIDLFVDQPCCNYSVAQQQLMIFLDIDIQISVSFKFSIMEDLCQRIPSVAVMIFKNLNNQSLIASKEASSELSQFMHNERFYWIKIIMKHNGCFLELALWNKILEKTPADIIRQLADAVQKFFTERVSRRAKQWTPLHIIA